MQWVTRKSQLSGTVRVPPSKSQSIRALLFGTLAHGESVIHNLLDSPDIEAMRRACEMMGARIYAEGNTTVVRGVSGCPECPDCVIDAGNSGLVYRFITALGAMTPGITVVTGDQSIRHRRPIAPLLSALRKLGARAESCRPEGGAPVIVQGPFEAGETEVLAQDSQLLSGLLVACAFGDGPFSIDVQDIGERPWIELTLEWFERLGIPYARRGFEAFHLPGRARVDSFEYTVPGDWSSASYPIAAALLTGSQITLSDIDIEDTQGDRALIGVLQEMGAEIAWDGKERLLWVDGSQGLVGTTVDVNPFVDAVTLLAVIGCFAEGGMRICGAAVARRKESDRIRTIATELRKMGAQVFEEPDGLAIRPSKLQGAMLESYADHRVALSLAVAGMAADGVTHIDGVECAAKTYTSFPEHMRDLGADLVEEREEIWA